MISAFSRALIGPTQRRLLDPLDLEQRIRHALVWCSGRDRMKVEFVEPEDANEVLNNGYVPLTRIGHVGSELDRLYYNHDRDPLQMDEIGIKVAQVVAESLWDSTLRQVVAELCFAGALMFHEPLVNTRPPSPHPRAVTARRFKVFFDLLGDGIVPVAVSHEHKRRSRKPAPTLFVVSSVLTS